MAGPSPTLANDLLGEPDGTVYIDGMFVSGIQDTSIMASTIFYSWQSDLPNNTNRTFIENVLDKAIKEITADLSIQEADRNGTLQLDKDTKGEPGSPPITDVIFRKISESAVFVPDLTFVGKTEDNRLIANPNVLIEYGYALKALGHSRILPIINTAYGEANALTLPFDMRHLRHPITYHLTDGADKAERQNVKEELGIQLVKAIKLVLQKHPPDAEQRGQGYVPVQPRDDDPSTFLKKDEPLGILDEFVQEPTTLIIPNNEHLFLRVHPTVTVERIGSSKKALDMAREGNLRPLLDLGRMFTSNHGRNKHGAFVCSSTNTTLHATTQLFLNKELWGINASVISKKLRTDQFKIDFGYFPYSYLCKMLIGTLSTYLTFCKEILNLPLPLKFIAGVTNVEGYRMTAPLGTHSENGEKYAGRVVNQHIVYEGEIPSYETSETELLDPFFDLLWEECGLTRSAER